MKKIFFSVLIISALGSSAKDILVLNNQSRFSGTVVKIKSCTVHFEADNTVYQIPADDIAFIQFENDQNLILEKNQESKCFKGGGDAKAFHGKVGWHLALGFLFGPLQQSGRQ